MIDVVCNWSGLDYSKIDAAFKKALSSQMKIFGKAITGKGRLGLKRHLTRAGGYADNSNIWKYGGKGGKRVFYNTGTFRDSPTFEVLPASGDMYSAVRVSFPDSLHPSTGGKNPRPSSITISKLAQQLTTGFSFTPTPQQKRAFWAKIDKSQFIGELGTGNGTWTSPARDFTQHLKSVEIYNEMLKRVDAALKVAAKKASTGKRS